MESGKICARILKMQSLPHGTTQNRRERTSEQLAWISNVLDAASRNNAGRDVFPGTKEVVTIYYSKVNPDKLKDVDSLCRYTKEEKPPCMMGWNKSTDLIHWM